MTRAIELHGTVAQRIRQVRDALAPGEMRVVAALTESYPTAGLVPIAQLAAEAGVSAPTALRLVGKLGFSGYGAFQEALRAEVQTRLFSPVTVYPAGVDGDLHSAIVDAANRYGEGLQATVNGISADDLARAVELLADPTRHVVTAGGRFSSILATQLSRYLHMLRPDVVAVEPNSGDHMASLIDIDATTVAVVFDYRRYQGSTVEWGMAAAERGAELIVVTDAYLSPLAARAATVFATSHLGPGPFDSMAHGFMFVELIVSLVATHLGGPARDRLAAFEELQVREEGRRGTRPTKLP
ncbi:MurR/RpiR family transcriptional regulator [Gordonia jinhuaensis]|nr:MurR/RpiR family transcriptional regulator [Gordonia jinhuaensis]